MKKDRRIRFIKSALKPADFPLEGPPEIALVGRSNAGKSSFLNALAGGDKVAKVSATPGKTRLLNFFQAGHAYVLVDMPGYGWAARDMKEMRDWRKAIDAYLKGRNSLSGVCLIMDVRRDWQQEEGQIAKLAQSISRPMALVLNKCDSLSQGELQKRIRALEASLEKLPQEIAAFPVSARTGKGVEECEEWMFRNWIQGGGEV